MSSVGAQTHDNETRPEEIYGHERVGVLSEFSYKYSILVCFDVPSILVFVVLKGSILPPKKQIYITYNQAYLCSFGNYIVYSS